MNYNPNKLLIGKIGNVYETKENGQKYNNMGNLNFAIVKEESYSTDKYKDILSGVLYVEFYSYWCSAGNKAICDLSPLTTFIQKIHNKVNEIKEIKKITTKIVNGKNISNKEINKLLYFLNNIDGYKEQFNQNNKEKDKEVIKVSDYIAILTNKDFEPIAGIDRYLEKIMINLASDKKNPILIGQSGIGKSSIVNDLALRIKGSEVPNFLKKKKIIDITNLITNTKYAEKLKDEFEKLILGIIKNNDIVFIDNIESIITLDNCLIDIVKNNIQNNGLKVIGTITKNNYNQYFYNNDINKLFEEIYINEPTDKTLYEIIHQTFINYSAKYNISYFYNMDEIIPSFIELTSKNNRIKNDNLYSDKDDICNPSLVVEIIDKIFAHARLNNQKSLTIDNIKYSLESCDKIYDNKKNEILTNLNSIISKRQKTLFKNYLIQKKV